MIEPNRLLRLLEPEGWNHQEGPSGDGFRWWILSHVTPQKRRLEVFLVADHGLSFRLPLGVRPTTDCREALGQYLLRLNDELRLAKVTHGRDGSLYLAAELPAEAISLAASAAVLRALSTYSEHFHREIEILASRAEVGRTWLSLLPEPDHEEDVAIVEIVSRAPMN